MAENNIPINIFISPQSQRQIRNDIQNAVSSLRIGIVNDSISRAQKIITEKLTPKIKFDVNISSINSARKKISSGLSKIDVGIRPDAASIAAFNASIQSKIKPIQLSINRGNLQSLSQLSKRLNIGNIKFSKLQADQYRKEAESFFAKKPIRITTKLVPPKRLLNQFGLELTPKIKESTKATQDATTAANAYSAATAKAAETTGTFAERIGFTSTRLASYLVPATAIFQLGRAFGSARDSIIEINRDINRLTQILNNNAERSAKLAEDVLGIATQYGRSGRELLGITTTLAQAGNIFSGNDLPNIIESLAQTQLAATFGDINTVTEGLIASLNQFNLVGSDTNRILDVANILSKNFAVESENIFEAVRSGGAAFASAGGDFESFAAIVTALRETTRLSSSTIGTGLNTISLRLFRPDVVSQLEELTASVGGIRNQSGELKDIKDIFIAIANATKDFSIEELAPIIELVSGIRQGKLLTPLLRDIQGGEGNSKFLKALKDAENASGSLARDAFVGLNRFDVVLGRIAARFEEVFKSISEDQGIKTLVTQFADLAGSLADVLNIAQPLLSTLIRLGAIKLSLAAIRSIPEIARGSGIYTAGSLKTAERRQAVIEAQRRGLPVNEVMNEMVSFNRAQLGISTSTQGTFGSRVSNAIINPEEITRLAGLKANISELKDSIKNIEQRRSDIAKRISPVVTRGPFGNVITQRENLADIITSLNRRRIERIRGEIHERGRRVEDFRGRFFRTAQAAENFDPHAGFRMTLKRNFEKSADQHYINLVTEQKIIRQLINKRKELLSAISAAKQDYLKEQTAIKELASVDRELKSAKKQLAQSLREQAVIERNNRFLPRLRRGITAVGGEIGSFAKSAGGTIGRGLLDQSGLILGITSINALDRLATRIREDIINPLEDLNEIPKDLETTLSKNRSNLEKAIRLERASVTAGFGTFIGADIGRSIGLGFGKAGGPIGTLIGAGAGFLGGGALGDFFRDPFEAVLQVNKQRSVVSSLATEFEDFEKSLSSDIKDLINVRNNRGFFREAFSFDPNEPFGLVGFHRAIFRTLRSGALPGSGFLDEFGRQTNILDEFKLGNLAASSIDKSAIQTFTSLLRKEFVGPNKEIGELDILNLIRDKGIFGDFDPLDFSKFLSLSESDRQASSEIIPAEFFQLEKLLGGRLGLENLNKSFRDANLAIESFARTIVNMSSDAQTASSILNDISLGTRGSQQRSTIANLNNRLASTISQNLIGGSFQALTLPDNFGDVVANRISLGLDRGGSFSLPKNFFGLDDQQTNVVNDLIKIRGSVSQSANVLAKRLGNKGLDLADAGLSEVEIGQAFEDVFKDVFKGLDLNTPEAAETFKSLRSVFIDRLVKDPTILQGDQSAVVSSILGALDPLQYISQRLNANFSELNEKIVQQSLAYQNSIDLQRQLLSIESRSISQRVSRIDIFRQLGATDFDVDEILKGISKDIRSSEFFGNTDEITNNLRLLAGQVKEAERVITAFNAGDLDTVSKFPGGIEEANRILIDYNRNQERLNQTIAKTDEDLSILRSRFQNLANISSRLRESLISRGRLNFGERLQSQFFSQQFENTIGNRLFDRGGIFGGVANSTQALSELSKLSPTDLRRTIVDSFAFVDNDLALRLAESQANLGDLISDIFVAPDGKPVSRTARDEAEIFFLIRSLREQLLIGGQSPEALLDIIREMQRISPDINSIEEQQLDHLRNINQILQKAFGSPTVNPVGSSDPSRPIPQTPPPQQVQQQAEQNNQNVEQMLRAAEVLASSVEQLRTSQNSDPELKQLFSKKVEESIDKFIQAASENKNTNVTISGSMNLHGFETVGKEVAAKAIVIGMMKTFIDQLDKSDPVQADIAGKFGRSIKLFEGDK